MKHKYFGLIILLAIVFSFYNCQEKKKKPVSAAELISTKTLGLAYLEENQNEEAEAQFLKLVHLDPTEALGYANLGIVYLRMGKYQQAEEWLQKAIKIDSKDPGIRVILAKVYEMSSRQQEAIKELEIAIKLAPNNIRALYSLTELYAASTDKHFLDNRFKYTSTLVEKAPGNIVPRLNLIDILIRNKKADAALEELEKLPQIFPEFPKEAVEYYDKAVVDLQANNPEKASGSFMVFHNYLKVTSPYQAGILGLKGPGGSLVGSPVITFDKQKKSISGGDWKAILAAIKFTDITLSAGLDFAAGSNVDGNKTHLTACDFDGDGDADLYTGYFDTKSETYKYSLLINEWGVFKDGAEKAGVSHKGTEYSAKFADYDNDGFIDLYIVKEGVNKLYKNSGEGTFEDVTKKAKVGDGDAGNSSLFFDFDHDGDLDIFITKQNTNLLFRNNSDDTFLDYSTESNLAGEAVNSTDAKFADFDDDGDIDLFVANSNSSNTLFSNQRQGVFKDVTDEAGLNDKNGTSSVTVGDYNNDGFPDIFTTSVKSGNCQLLINLGNGTFEKDTKSTDLYKTLQNVQAYDAAFIDFDNDGFLDLLVVGESNKKDSSGVFLYHNNGAGKLFVTSNVLPEDLISGEKIVTLDYNEDGDTDIAIIEIDGSIRFLRNDGGNNNHFVKMKLVGLRTGSAKNNFYGIGAKVEIRSGNLYQTKVVTESNIHFGLGARSRADVIRILWTNGVPQNIFFPGTDQNLVEEQVLKGSCPFLYTWNGTEYSFVKDIMWRSALGMPLGIMGEDTKYASPAASVDYIKIPGELLKQKNGKYSIQITGELWETIYFDKVQLVALDHPDSVDVFVDERFTPPVNPDYELFQIKEKLLPVSATDKMGTNLLQSIIEKDDIYISNMKPAKYQGVTEMTDLILDIAEIDQSQNIHLFLNGWLFPSDASINSSISQSGEPKIVSPYIQAINNSGEWETIVENISFPMGKDKTIIVDLTNKFPTSDTRIRIRTNMEIYWDHIYYSNKNVTAPVNSTILNPEMADLHYRGFSRTYKKGGRYGPHWFDYSTVSTDQMWRDLEGNYTRFGDVLPLLTEADNMYIVMNAGDETSIEFSTKTLPELPAGWKRDFLIHSVGWVKDGDLNTASGNKVLPLPFHGMSKYPYGADESYPQNAEHQKYLKEYNTRIVSFESFRVAISDAK